MGEFMKKLLIDTTILFIITSFCHFIYDIMPCFVTSLFFPVNESIFQHLKMLFTAAIIFTIIKYIKTKDKNIFINMYLRSMFLIIILLILYLPEYYLFGEIMIVTLIILYISCFLTTYLMTKIKFKKEYKLFNIICLILLLVDLYISYYFTYYPIKDDFFILYYFL